MESNTYLYFCRQMEKEIEEKLRSKFALIDRTDPSAIQAAQQVRAGRKTDEP